jgi:hypothetical protein
VKTEFDKAKQELFLCRHQEQQDKSQIERSQSESSQLRYMVVRWKGAVRPFTLTGQWNHGHVRFSSAGQPGQLRWTDDSVDPLLSDHCSTTTKKMSFLSWREPPGQAIRSRWRKRPGSQITSVQGLG